MLGMMGTNDTSTAMGFFVAGSMEQYAKYVFARAYTLYTEKIHSLSRVLCNKFQTFR